MKKKIKFAGKEWDTYCFWHNQVWSVLPNITVCYCKGAWSELGFSFLAFCVGITCYDGVEYMY